MENQSVKTKTRGRGFLKSDVDILNAPIVKSSLQYAIPLILASILSSLYNAADVAVVGNLADKYAVASVGATSTIIGFLVLGFQSLSVGHRVILSHAIGRGDSEEIKKTIKTGYTFSILLGLFVALVGSIFTVPMLNITGCPEDVIEGATLYMRLFMLSVPATIFTVFNSCVLSVKGDTVRPFTYSAISGLTNVVLNIVLVLTTGEAVASVAIATVISSYVSVVLHIIKLVRLDGEFKLNPLSFGINRNVLLKILRYGFPSMISSLAFSFTNIQIQSAINSFGASGISGNTAAINIEAFAMSICGSIGATVSAFVGQCIGAGKRDRTLQIIKKSYFIWFIICFAVSCVLFIFGKNLLGIFIPGEYDAIDFGAVRVTYMALATVVRALIDVNAGVFIGFGKTFYKMLIDIVGVCGFRTLWMMFIYPISPTPDMLYICYPISYTLVALVGFLIIYVMIRKYSSGKNIEI